MKINEMSVRWAIEHLKMESDTDLFPRPFEIGIINDLKEKTVQNLINVDLGNYTWNASRRFLIPKDDLSFRNITQLDPIDSILFAAIIHQFGQNIESRRTKFTDNPLSDRVFSYRFSPDSNGQLFSTKNSWQKFWESCRKKSDNYEKFVVTDIVDFYNQIYHHTIENQLNESSFPPTVKRSIMNLLTSITQKTSRGIPIGPHSFHLVAEMSLIPVDESLSIQGFEFCRYVDDIIIFCKTEDEARTSLYALANTLDKQQRLALNKQKTHILSKSEFVKLCQNKLIDEPQNKIEEDIIETIRRKSGGDFYRKISLGSLTPDELKLLSRENIEKLLDHYKNQLFPDFSRIRWLYRRLAQIGTPNAIEYSINNLESLIPAINDVCLYITSASENFSADWKSFGEKVLDIMDLDIIKTNEFFQLTILNLFGKNQALNHIDKLIKIYGNSPDTIKRKILFAARANKAGSWIRELKENYYSMETWCKRAYLIATAELPSEEREFFLKAIKPTLNPDDFMEHLIIEWSKNQ